MKSSILTSALLISSAFGTVVPRAGKKVDYNGYKVIRVTAQDNVKAQVESLAAHVLNPGKAEMDVVVAPDNVAALTALVAESKVINEDVGAALQEEDEMSTYAGKTNIASSPLHGLGRLTMIVPSEAWFTAYHPYADHLQFLRDLQGGYPGNSEIVNVGTSVQGRPLTGIHIWGSGGKGSRPAVVIHGNVHAREWITSMSTEYFAWQLLTKYASDATIKSYVDKFDFYITPIGNPDGFVYSQTTDRLWRKNRQTVSGNTCVGRDINRNWPYKWEVTGGASTNPCSETYKGLAAGDAPENRGLRTQIDALRASRGISLYLDIQYFLPSFHTTT